MSKMPRKAKERKFKSIGKHREFLERITKTLYYGKLPPTECLSLPVTELAAELFSEAKTGRSLDRLHCYDAAKISRNACVSPCSLILAILYIEQLKAQNPQYLQKTAPSELFLVSLMVSNKFLHDDGEEDEVFVDEWATSGGITVNELILLEKEFLNAMEWKVYVGQEAFWTKLKDVETVLAKKEGSNRGWFTYTELENLLIQMDAYVLVQYLSYLIGVFVATYAMGVLTILGSVFIVSHMPGNCLQSETLMLEESQLVVLDKKNDTKNEDLTATLDYIENDLNNSTAYKPRCIDATTVLKTGIILASLKTGCNKRNCTKTQFSTDARTEKEENTSYAWWTNLTMKWLSKVSEAVEKFELFSYMKYFTYSYVDASLPEYKKMHLADHIDKAIKLRIQDQLERSWHKEWTDTLKRIVLPGKYVLPCYF